MILLQGSFIVNVLVVQSGSHLLLLKQHFASTEEHFRVQFLKILYVVI